MKKTVILIILLIFSACGEDPDASGENILLEAEEAETVSAFPFAFSSEDLRGNNVTDASIGDFDVYFIYYWTTWCPSCVSGMPSLAELADEYGDRVGFLSLLGDFESGRDAAINITENAGVPFITTDSRNRDFRELMSMLNSGFVPTSVIIGSDGNIIGERIVGSNMKQFREAIESALGE